MSNRPSRLLQPPRVRRRTSWLWLMPLPLPCTKSRRLSLPPWLLHARPWMRHGRASTLPSSLGRRRRPSPRIATCRCPRDRDPPRRRWRSLHQRRLHPRHRPHHTPACVGCQPLEYTIGGHDHFGTLIDQLQAVTQPRVSHASSLRPL
jgi:hypothetical protein